MRKEDRMKVKNEIFSSIHQFSSFSTANAAPKNTNFRRGQYRKLQAYSGIPDVNAVRIWHNLRRNERERIAELEFVAVNKITQRLTVID